MSIKTSYQLHGTRWHGGYSAFSVDFCAEMTYSSLIRGQYYVVTRMPDATPGIVMRPYNSFVCFQPFDSVEEAVFALEMGFEFREGL